jgi:steroid 5-alpha reductase family enzyme
MNKNEQMSWLELIRGIANFVLSTMLLLSMAAGEMNFLPVGILGLVVANFGLLKDTIDDEKHA